MPDDASGLWTWCLKQKQDRLIEILAFLVARSATAGARHADDLAESLGLNLRNWFTPDADNYFGRIGKDQILKDMAEMGEAGSGALKKGDLAKAAAKLADDKNDWLPVPMRPTGQQPEIDERDDEDEDDMDEAA
jgi:ParB family chromosome partitioning protein